jgi:hypothetical protein
MKTSLMTCRLSIDDSGLIYRNPAPHLRSVHAYYPSLVHLDGDELLASFVLGTAMESMDLHACLARSVDGGRTWCSEGPLHNKSDRHTETCRISKMGDGQVALLLSESERMDPEMGATNPDNLGHVPTRLSIHRSSDGGRTWAEPTRIEPPLVGPTFELCSPISEMQDGTWLLPTSTWRGWDGEAPNGMKAVAFVSKDQGATWPSYVDVMDGTSRGIIFWEQKIVQINRGRLLSVAWAYDEQSKTDLANHYCIGCLSSLEFSDPEPTPLHGQTPEILHLGGGVILCVYRRVDEAGLWACMATIGDDDQWTMHEHVCLWSPATLVKRSSPSVMTEEFRGLKFGAPSLVRLNDSTALLAFWCVEDCISNIRWIRLCWDAPGLIGSGHD